MVDDELTLESQLGVVGKLAGSASLADKYISFLMEAEVPIA